MKALQGVARNPKTPLALTDEQLKAFRNRLVNGRLAGLLKPKAL